MKKTEAIEATRVMCRRERLAAIRDRLAKATKGPWRVEARYLSDGSVACISAGINRHGDGPESYPISTLRAGVLLPDNAELVVNAPADLAFLLSEVERLREAVCEYGEHQGVCPRKYNIPNKPCTCGLDALLASFTAPQPEQPDHHYDDLRHG